MSPSLGSHCEIYQGIKKLTIASTALLIAALSSKRHVTVNPSLDQGTGRPLSLSFSRHWLLVQSSFFSTPLPPILVRPFANLPFHDDWTYAWSVEHFVNTGELQVLDWSVHYPFVQILWGVLFCLPLGFSFSALRVSTVVLAWIGALGPVWHVAGAGARA